MPELRNIKIPNKNKPKKHLDILGLDPSLSNWGICHMTYSPFSSLKLIDTDIIRTKPSKEKKPKNIDDLDRARTLSKRLRELISYVDVVVAELPFGSQSSRAMASYGICLGVLAGVDIPVISVTPFEVKKIVGNRETKKEEIIAWVNSTYLNVFINKPKNQTEHMADAIVACHAALPKLEKFYENFTGSQRTKRNY